MGLDQQGPAPGRQLAQVRVFGIDHKSFSPSILFERRRILPRFVTLPPSAAYWRQRRIGRIESCIAPEVALDAPPLNPSRKAVGLCLESLEDRTVPSTVAWSSRRDGNFNDAAAWTDQSNGSHHIPTPGDDVVISGYVVTATANYAVDSINDNSPFQILGSFTITAQGEPSELNIPEIAVGGILYDAGAQVVTLDGSGDQSNPVLLGGTLDVGSGGVIRFNHGCDFSVGPQFAFASTLDGPLKRWATPLATPI